MTKRRGVSAEFIYVAFVSSKTKLYFGYKIVKVLNYANNNYRVTNSFFFKKTRSYLTLFVTKTTFLHTFTIRFI